MIPLIRPTFPDARRACEHLRQAVAARHLSNFGALHGLLMGRLSTLASGFALPVTSGTAAIEVALRSAGGFLPGDRIGLPDFTHAGTLLAVLRAGLVPVFLGVDETTWTLRPEEVEAAYRRDNIRGAVVVSPFGYCLDTAEWEDMSRRAGMPLVYDLAGAFGNFEPTRNPRCYSLHATKNMGVGEGGFVVFREMEERGTAKRLINFDTLPDRSIGSLDGMNYKVDELHAAFLMAALEDPHLSLVRERVAAKAAVLRFYEDMLPEAFAPAGLHHPSLCVLGYLPAAELEEKSDRLGAVFKRYYPLLSRMPACSEVARISVSGDEMTTTCALPADVTMDEAYRVADIVKRFTEAQP